jgi:hypothetical protein
MTGYYDHLTRQPHPKNFNQVMGFTITGFWHPAAIMLQQNTAIKTATE